MNKTQYNYYKDLWIVNGCWWQWSKFNFSEIMRNNIQWFKEYDTKKASKLIEDIEMNICAKHDCYFREWGNIYHYTKANLIFSIDMYKILHWTTKLNRVWIALLCFIWLMRYWYKYFNWKERRTLPNKPKND